MLRYCWGMYDYRFLKGFAWSHSLSCLAKGIILPLKTVPIRRVNSWFFKRVRHLATRGYLWGGQLQVGFSEPACWDCYLAQHRAAVKARWASYPLEDGKTTDKDRASMTLLVKLAKWRFWNSFCSVCYIYFDFHKLKMTKFLKNTQNALIHGKESLQEKEKEKKKKLWNLTWRFDWAVIILLKLNFAGIPPQRWAKHNMMLWLKPVCRQST